MTIRIEYSMDFSSFSKFFEITSDQSKDRNDDLEEYLNLIEESKEEDNTNFRQTLDKLNKKRSNRKKYILESAKIIDS
jgi:hypothetical protein